MRTISPWMGRLLQGLSWKKLFWILLGAAIATFGIHNIHQQAGITEGGVIGAMLLAGHWLGFSPSVITPVLDVACYLLAWRYLGGMFIKISVLSTASVSLFYRLWEQFPYMLPDLSSQPLAAALLGGLFVGIGVGLIVRQGGSSGGDDALALVIHKLSRWGLARCYLATDLTVLALSLSYIPAWRIAFSLITVTLSSFLIEKVQNFGRKVPA